jgi:hypothetical protein
MPGYLEEYGAGEEKRGKLIRWTLIGIAALLALGAAGYFGFRDYSENRAVRSFVEALQAKDFARAYSFWGCTVEKPCRDYRFEKFLEDWGPQSSYANVANVRIEHPQLTPGALGWIRRVLGIQYSCQDGVIYYLNFGKGEPAVIYVLRADKTIGFAPWTTCAPRIKM